MGKIVALAKKDLKLLLRDKSGTFFVLFFPLIFAVFFGMIYAGGGGTSSIPIAVVDEDSTTASLTFIQKLIDGGGLDVLRTDSSQAEALVKQGKRAAYILLYEGFGESTQNLFWGEPTRIAIGVDPSRKAETAMLQGMLTGYFMEGVTSSMSDPQAMRERIADWRQRFTEAPDSTHEELGYLARFFDQLDSAMAELETEEATADSTVASPAPTWQPVAFDVHDVSIQREGPKNSFEVTFPQALIWAMIGCAAGFGIGLVSEKTHGTLVRLRMAPLSLGQILGGKALACLTAIVAVSILLLVIFVIIFGIRPGSYLLLLLAIFSSGVCFVGIMMMLSVLGKTEASAGGVGWAALLAMAMLGGGMIPLFLMPSWLRVFSGISPIKWAMLTIEGTVWRGFSVGMIAGYSALLLGIGIGLFFVGTRLFRLTVE